MREFGASYVDKAMLGKEAGQVDFFNKVVLVTKNIQDNGLLDTKIDSKFRADQASKIFGQIGPAVADATTLKNTLRDPNKTDAQKENAGKSVGILAKSVCWAMLHSDDKEMVKEIGLGDLAKIEARLPGPFKGLGKEIRENVIDEPVILEKLVFLDRIRERTKDAGETGKQTLAKNIQKVVDDLAVVEVDSTKEDQLGMVTAFLGVEAETLIEGGVSTKGEGNEKGKVDSAEEEYFRDLAAYQKEEGNLKHEITVVSLEEWVDAQISITAPRERAPQLWEYKPPTWMNGESRKRWRQLLKLADGMLGGTYQKQKDGGYKTSLEMVKKNSMSLMELPEEDFKFIQKHEVLNGSGVAHEIFRDLMMPVTNSALIDGVRKQSTTFVFKHKIMEEDRYYEDNVKLFASNPVEYKRKLAEKLVEKGVVKNIEAAKLSVALTMDALEVGGVFSGADILRKLNWESDAVKLAQRPIEKFNAKLGEMWGGAGTWNAYCKAVARGDTRAAAKVAEGLGIIPKLLAGSFLDVKFSEDGKSWAQKMYDGEEIKMEDSSNDLYFGWRKDSLNAACEFMMYITKEKPLQFKSFNEPDNVISDWIASLYNDIQALRGNGVSLLPVEAICGAFGGSVGIWPFEGPYFRVASMSDPLRHTNYFSIGTEVARQLGLSSSDEEKFLNFFGVDKRYFVDLNDKMTDYSAILNPNSSRSYKESRYTKGSLLRKRK